MTVNGEIRKLAEKAKHNIKVAKDEFDRKVYDVCVSRSYYAMFYIAEALLLTKNLRFSKHSGVHAAFGQYFAKTGEVAPKLHRMLLEIFDIRDTADYDYMKEIPKKLAKQVLKDAQYFVSEVKKKLEVK